MRIVSILITIITLALQMALSSTAQAEEVPAEYREAVTKGLDWLVRNQYKDGHWGNPGGQQSVAMTALGGMALLMEGSTICEGKYHHSIHHAVDWLMQRSQPNGLIGMPNTEYMYDHGFAMLFLSSIVGEEEDADRRCKLVDILERAARFSRLAQSSRGGWSYTSAKDSNDRDEGSVTVTQLQALRAARNAGIAVSSESIQDALKYLRNATNNRQGGVNYSLSDGGGGDCRLALTAAAIVCGFSAGEYDSPLVKQWFRFCRAHVPDFYGNGGRAGHDEYTYYYYAQAIYMLGEDGWTKLFPDDKRSPLTWSSFRKGTFDSLIRTQAADGSWNNVGVGPVYATALHLSILQLDKGVLPIYQR